MRRFSSIVAIALSTLLLVSICSAQQASTTGASATATVTVGGTSASAKDPTVLPPYTTGYIAPAFDQEDENAPLRGYYEVKPLEGVSNAMVRAESAAGTTIPLWTYNIRSTRDGNPYLGVMVGAKPALNSSTTIPTQIVPVIINLVGVHKAKMESGTTSTYSKPLLIRRSWYEIG
jgi:ABC-type antimicrobial peptide transport system permease subunit